MKILTLCFLMLTSTWAFGSGIHEVERIINLSSTLQGVCASRICFVAPRSGVSSQEYQDEVAFVKKHLNGLGVKLRYYKGNPNELSRSRKDQAI